MKKVHLYEVKLKDGTVYCGEIIQSNNRVVWLRVLKGKKIRLFKNSIIMIKDLGWQEIKK
jgi:hypothetical protein